jgi:hypothetical protein
MRRWMSWVCFALPAAALSAEPVGTRSAAEELDAELNAQVKIPGPELVVITDGPDPERYALSDGAVTLDGKALPGPVQPGWGKRFWEGPIAAGNHVITAEFVYRAARTGPYPWSDTYGFRVPGKVEFQAQRGLRLVVHLRVETHDDAEDARGKLAFRAALEPEMIGKVDDTPLPPPPKPLVPPQGGLMDQIMVPVTSIPETPPKPKTPKKKKPKVAATPAGGASPGAATPAGGTSLGAATARLQRAIASPTKPDGGTP